MIRSVLKRRGFSYSSLVRLLDVSGTRSLRTEAIGVTSSAPAWTGENVLTRMGFLRSCSGVSHKQKISSSSSSSSSSDSLDSDLEEVLPPPQSDNAILLQSLNAFKFQQHLKEMKASKKQITYSDLLELAEHKRFAATSDESRQLCDAMIASGTIFRYGESVYLDPAEIADSVRSVLPGTVAEAEASIEKLKKEIEPLEKKKEEMEEKTGQISTVLLWIGALGIVCLFAGLWWMTYIEYSWDVVEPIAYFITLAVAVFYYVYYCFVREDFQFSSITSHVKKLYNKKLEETVCEKYAELSKKLEVHRSFVKRFKR